MDSFSTQRKLEFIQAWRSSGRTQEQQCAIYREQGGPSSRCMRSWIATLSKPRGIRDEARAIVARALRDLQDLLQALDAVEVDEDPQGACGSEPVSSAAAVGGRPARPAAASADAESAAAQYQVAVAPDAAQRGTMDAGEAVVQDQVDEDGEQTLGQPTSASAEPANTTADTAVAPEAPILPVPMPPMRGIYWG